MEVQNDLTKGSVTSTLIRYAIPLVLMNLMQSLYSIADMMIAGHFIGSSGQSAITNAGQVMNLITQIAIGITIGGNVLIGRYYGSRSDRDRKEASGSLLSLCMILGVIFTVGVLVSARVILSALDSPSMGESVRYLRICALGMVFIFAYNGLSSVMRSVGNSRQPMICVLIAVIVNVALDILFVAVLGMGVGGAAAAMVISQFIAFSAALVTVHRQREFLGATKKYIRIVPGKAKDIFRLGIPISLQQAIAAVSWLAVTFIINQYGVSVSAGNGVSARVKDFCQLFIVAISSGAATMIAQTLGSGLADRAKKVMYSAMKITLITATAVIIIVEIFAPQLIGIFTDDPEVLHAGVENLRIEIMGQWFYAIFLVYHALAIGAGDSYFAMFSSFVNCIAVRIVLAVIFNRFFGITGVYWALMIATSSSVPLGFFYTRSNVWKRGILQKSTQ